MRSHLSIRVSLDYADRPVGSTVQILQAATFRPEQKLEQIHEVSQQGLRAA